MEKKMLAIGLVLIVISAATFACGCIGEPPGVGDTTKVGGLKVTLNSITTQEDFLFGKNVVVVLTLSNVGKETQYLTTIQNDVYIQDSRGRVYRAQRAGVMQGVWEQTLVPGETRAIGFYFPSDTPTTGAKLVVSYYDERVEFKL